MASTSFGIGQRFLVVIALGIALASPAQASPDWPELPPEAQAILAPLGPEWSKIDPDDRRKWLRIAERYPNMGEEKQARIQHRMIVWAKLTPEQRKAAREKYRNIKRASPEQREALKQMWQEYQALPEEEKARYGVPADGAAK
ncbi:MAG: DUF3106 domain-containing protein [Zoogloeaceae bacterium]|jgi:membrane-bound lytic murein transglycosylase B|nr:DUF3106 domain-containing protein [Zoogloeaceae bacterium]